MLLNFVHLISYKIVSKILLSLLQCYLDWLNIDSLYAWKICNLKSKEHEIDENICIQMNKVKIVGSSKIDKLCKGQEEKKSAHVLKKWKRFKLKNVFNERDDLQLKNDFSR